MTNIVLHVSSIFELYLNLATQKDMCMDEYVYQNKDHTEYKLVSHIRVHFNPKEQGHDKNYASIDNHYQRAESSVQVRYLIHFMHGHFVLLKLTYVIRLLKNTVIINIIQNTHQNIVAVMELLLPLPQACYHV